MRSVFILLGHVQYEGPEIVSVHASEASALLAQNSDAERRKAEDRYPFDKYSVEEWNVLD